MLGRLAGVAILLVPRSSSGFGQEHWIRQPSARLPPNQVSPIHVFAQPKSSINPMKLDSRSQDNDPLKDLRAGATPGPLAAANPQALPSADEILTLKTVGGGYVPPENPSDWLKHQQRANAEEPAMPGIALVFRIFAILNWIVACIVLVMAMSTESGAMGYAGLSLISAGLVCYAIGDAIYYIYRIMLAVESKR